MVDQLTFHRNAFHETMLGLDFTDTPECSADLFSRACVEQYRKSDSTQFGYLFAQVFEANVLQETALLEGVAYESLAELRHQPTPAADRLADLIANADELSVVELVNLAAALISISRFDPARRALELAMARASNARETFEAWMLVFVVANRCDDDAGSVEAFHRMRAVIESGAVRADRALDACSQAVVWHMKRGGYITEDDFAWYVVKGRALAERPVKLDPGALSSWYRALAMVPAAHGKTGLTREFMLRARDAADETLVRRPRSYELHLLKTYHESSLKEHMYITGDADKAEESGRDLIALDPAWSPSYGEAAEAYVRFGRLEEAAAMYEKAVATGPPYVGHHLFQAARTREKSGDHARALAHYYTLSLLVPDDAAVLGAARDLAHSERHASRGYFDDMLDRLSAPVTGRLKGSDLT